MQPLLDAVVDYLPSPLDVPPVSGLAPGNGEVVRNTADDEPFAALAFKVAVDPYVGKLTYFRVYSGVLKAGSYVFNVNKERRERVSRILQMHANHREDRSEIYAGELAAAVGLKFTGTGDTLSTPDKPIVLESMVFPEPVIAVAIEPKTKADEEKLSASLQKLAEEDPTFRVHSDEETGQTIIEGMGELHLEIMVDRLLREFKVDANVGRPQVAYRETVTRPAQHVEGRFVRQTGGRGQYGHVVIDLEPYEPGEGYVFENRIVGGTIPRDYIPAVDQGAQEAMSTGHTRRLPHGRCQGQADGRLLPRGGLERARLQDRRARSPEECGPQARPVLLEPMMAVEVVDPAGVHGRRHRRPELAAGSHRRDGTARQRPGHRRCCASVGHVRVRDRPALDDAGARHLHHAVQALRGGPRVDRRRDRGQGARGVGMSVRHGGDKRLPLSGSVVYTAHLWCERQSFPRCDTRL